MLSISSMRSLLAAISGLLSVSWMACSTPPDDGEAGAGADALPPLARAFDGTIQPTALATGPDGDVLFSGTFSFDVDFGGGPLTAEPDSSAFLAHLDAGGEHLWSGGTGSGDSTHDVEIGPFGDLYVVGQFDGNINFGSGKLAGDNDAFFAAFEAGGVPDHSFSAGGDYPDLFTNVAATPAGIVVVAGRLGHDVDLGAGAPDGGSGMRTTLAAYDRAGHHLWEQRLPDVFGNGFQIATGPAGEVFLAGDAYIPFSIGDLPAPEGLVVVKMAPSGEPLWVQSTLGGPDVARFQALAVDGRGDVVVAAVQREPLSFGGVEVPSPGGDFGGYVARLNGDGEVKHVKTFGVDGYDTSMSLGVSESGDSVLAVSTYYPVDFGTGPKGSPGIDNWAVVMARWDSSGTLIEAEDLPGTGDERVFDVAMVGGSPVLLGTFNDEITIGDETLASTSGNSLFIARLEK